MQLWIINHLCEIRVTVLKAPKWHGSQNMVVQKWQGHLGSHEAWQTFLSISQSRALFRTLSLLWELEKLSCGYQALWIHWWQFVVPAKLLLDFELILPLEGVPVLAPAPIGSMLQQTCVVLPLLSDISIWLETSWVLWKLVIRCFFRAHIHIDYI